VTDGCLFFAHPFAWFLFPVFVVFRVVSNVVFQDMGAEAWKTDFVLARLAGQHYKTPSQANQRLLDIAAVVLRMSTREAAALLQQRHMLPVRKPKAGMGMRVAYKYIRRAVEHLNTGMSTTVVSTWVRRMHALKGIGQWMAVSPTSNRQQLTITAAEAATELRENAFVKDAYGRIAMLDCLLAAIDENGGTEQMICWTGANRSSRVIRCAFGHVANVSFRVCVWCLDVFL